ncbi:MAG: hypothetical protein K8Q99_01730 [Acholeplasmataceae bacterium]|nr:hypothetical protein [Acholeplasmataceae bacterium]
MINIKRIFLIILITFIIVFTANIVFAQDTVVQDFVLETQNIAPSTSSLLSNRYTQTENYDVATNPYVDLDGYTFLGKNDTSNIELYVNDQDLSFRIVELENGYIWGSSFDYDYFDVDNPLYDLGDVGSNLTWQNKFNSPIIINYYMGTNLREETMFSPSSRFTYQPLTDGRVGYKANITFGLSKVQVTLYVYIDDMGLHYEVPYETIVENGTNPLASMTLFPFFAATKRLRTPGYIMIPDGVGALIRVDDVKGKEVYTKKFYSADIGLNQESTEEYLYANVYGMVHGVDQNGFLSIIEKGAGNAILTHVPAQNQSDMNWTYVTYEFRSSYTQFLNQSQTSSIRLIQENRSQYDIKQTYQFLTNDQANYVGMANLYQEHLVSNYQLERLNALQNISLHLDVLAAENKKALIGRSTFSMTTTEELQNIINDLELNNITNLDITYHGYGNDGYSFNAPNYNKFEKKVGSKSDFIDLNNSLSNAVDLFYTVSYPYASSLNNSVSTRDVAQSISQEILIADQAYYMYKLDQAILELNDSLAAMQDYGVDKLAFNFLGNALYTDYTTDLSRSESIELFQNLAQVTDDVAIEKPFSYLWFADVIYDIPMYSSQQSKFSDTVPFYAMVLSGYQTTYGRSSNFFSNKTNELLRMIDYGVYPSFYITHEASYLLLNTGSNNIFTSRYEDWKNEIVSQYEFVNDALKNVTGQSFISREVLGLGVVKNTYTNHTVIYINYSGNDVVVEGVSVNAMEYEVINP